MSSIVGLRRLPSNASIEFSYLSISGLNGVEVVGAWLVGAAVLFARRDILGVFELLNQL